MLHLYRDMLHLRRAEPALHAGTFRMIDRTDDVLAYERGAGGERLVVALNIGDADATVAELAGAEVLLSTAADAVDGAVLRARTAVVVKLR